MRRKKIFLELFIVLSMLILFVTLPFFYEEALKEALLVLQNEPHSFIQFVLISVEFMSFISLYTLIFSFIILWVKDNEIIVGEKDIRIENKMYFEKKVIFVPGFKEEWINKINSIFNSDFTIIVFLMATLLTVKLEYKTLLQFAESFIILFVAIGLFWVLCKMIEFSFKYKEEIEDEKR